MKNLAIITARGGSKRIPKKNIRPFLGKPIMAYSIEAALNSGLFDEVMVSTDSEEFAEIARQYGAKVPFMRSAETANDYATTMDVLVEVVNKYKEMGQEFDYVACLYPCAPFTTPERLQEAFHMLEESDADKIFPVCAFSTPPLRSFVIRDGKLVYSHPELRNLRTQDMEKHYHDCGQFYIHRARMFDHPEELGTSIPYITSEEITQDIDNLTDWELAEIKYKMFVLKEK